MPFSRAAIIRDVVGVLFDTLSEIKSAQSSGSAGGAEITDAEVEAISARIGGQVSGVIARHLLAARASRG